jgi:hypothetical protein
MVRVGFMDSGAHSQWQAVVHTLFGERFHAREEFLLLGLIRVRTMLASPPHLRADARDLWQTTIEEHLSRITALDALVRQNSCLSRLLGAYTGCDLSFRNVMNEWF